MWEMFSDSRTEEYNSEDSSERSFHLEDDLTDWSEFYREVSRVWAWCWDSDALRVLVHRDVNLKHKNELNKNVLHYVALDNLKVVQFFLKHDFHSDCRNNRDLTSLCYVINDLKVSQSCDISSKIYQIVRILIDVGANSLLRCANQISLEESISCKYSIHVITCIFSELKREHIEQIYKCLARLQEEQRRQKQKNEN